MRGESGNTRNSPCDTVDNPVVPRTGFTNFDEAIKDCTGEYDVCRGTDSWPSDEGYSHNLSPFTISLVFSQMSSFTNRSRVIHVVTSGRYRDS
jgi:hypothetical protein